MSFEQIPFVYTMVVQKSKYCMYHGFVMNKCCLYYGILKKLISHITKIMWTSKHCDSVLQVS